MCEKVLMHMQLLQAGNGERLGWNCQAHTFTATTPDCHYSRSPKPVHHMEDVTKNGPTEETASSGMSELPLPVVLNTPLRYPRDGTVPMNFDQSCISFACCAPAVEATTTTRHDDCEPLLHLTMMPEQELLRGYEGNTKLAF